jgi:hypothetical protein
MDQQPDFDVPFGARRRFLQQAASRLERGAASERGFPELYGTHDIREGVSRLWRELAANRVICAANGLRADQFGLDEALRPQLVLDDGYRIVAPDSHALRADSYRPTGADDQAHVVRQLSDLIDLLAGEALDLAERRRRSHALGAGAPVPPPDGDVVAADSAGPAMSPTNARRQVIASPTGESLVIEDTPSSF